VDAIARAGLGDRTAIVVSADHGEAFKEHDILFHGRRLWEEVVRVPWVVVAPDLEPRRVAARVSQVEFAATVCDLLGVAKPAQSRGSSLLPYATGAAAGDRRILLEQPLGPYMPEANAVIDGGWKLTHTMVGNRYELYDLGADPGEKDDLAASRPDELARMKMVYDETRGGLERNADVYRP
jgi:arylsulfatase A-like enzyme